MKYFIIGLLIGSLGVLSMDSYSMDLYQLEQLRLLQEMSNGINNTSQVTTKEFYSKPLTKVDRKRIHERICKEQIEQRNKGMHVYVLSTCK